MSTFVLVLLAVTVVATATFVITLARRKRLQLIHKIYLCLAAVTVVWMLALMMLYFIGDNKTGQYVVDSITNIGALVPVLALLISLVFVKGWSRLPRWTLPLFIMPTISILMVWTNPLHGFYYRHFSIVSSEVEFGWYFYIHSVYQYVCVLMSVVTIIAFAVENRSQLYTRQAILLAAGNIIPIIVNLCAMTKIIPLTIVSTPLAYVFGVVLLHGLAIFSLHLFDIKPMATNAVLERISDCYLILGAQGLVVSYNDAFAATFGREYGIRENMLITECAAANDPDSGIGIHTLLNSVEASRESSTTITYEQSIATRDGGGEVSMKYFMVDVTPLISDGENVGFIVFFKDVTKLKESMLRLQNSQARLMEQERLAFLGQMVGGIAHNLKTPIMSISGSVTSVDNLIDESCDSLGDGDVTEDDYREIFGEMRLWTDRIHEACSYMSDIITAVKGQAAGLNSAGEDDFTIDEMLKRAGLLLRHELMENHCTIVRVNGIPGDVQIHGDINSMVQVINNLIDNAVDAMKPSGGTITVETRFDGNKFSIRVRDEGSGIPPEIGNSLFKQMTTSKGARGSGLGLFISNTIIKARFGGSMRFENNPDRGTTFIITLPGECLTGDRITGGGTAVAEE